MKVANSLASVKIGLRHMRDPLVTAPHGIQSYVILLSTGILLGNASLSRYSPHYPCRFILRVRSSFQESLILKANKVIWNG